MAIPIRDRWGFAVLAAGAAIAITAAGCSIAMTDSAIQSTVDATQLPDIAFVGDSVMAGAFFNSDNTATADNFVRISQCANPQTDDRCANNNPGAASATPMSDSGVACTTTFISYPCQFARMVSQSPDPSAVTPPKNVYNFAVSGSGPVQWSGSGDQLDKNHPNFYAYLYDKGYPSPVITVMNLGADPLLSLFVGLDSKPAPMMNGDCLPKDPNVGYTPQIEQAAVACMDTLLTTPLNQLPVVGGGFTPSENMTQLDYLKSAFKDHLDYGPVLVEKYYASCPSTFGRLGATFIKTTGLSPSGGQACRPDDPDAQDGVNQDVFAVVKGMVDHANAKIDQVIGEIKAENPGAQIASICPGNIESAYRTCRSFDYHQSQSYRDGDQPWIMDWDTGAHPNGAGASILAKGVLSGLCTTGLAPDFCNYVNGSKPSTPSGWAPNYRFTWNRDDAKNCSGDCVMLSMYNNTPLTWTLDPKALGQGNEANSYCDSSVCPNGTALIPPPLTIPAYQSAWMYVRSGDGAELVGVPYSTWYATSSDPTTKHSVSITVTNSIPESAADSCGTSASDGNTWVVPDSLYWLDGDNVHLDDGWGGNCKGDGGGFFHGKGAIVINTRINCPNNVDCRPAPPPVEATYKNTSGSVLINTSYGAFGPMLDPGVASITTTDGTVNGFTLQGAPVADGSLTEYLKWSKAYVSLKQTSVSGSVTASAATLSAGGLEIDVSGSICISYLGESGCDTFESDDPLKIFVSPSPATAAGTVGADGSFNLSGTGTVNVDTNTFTGWALNEVIGGSQVTLQLDGMKQQ